MKRWICFILLPLVAACRVAVLHGLAEHETNRIIAILQNHGIPAEKRLEDPKRATWAIVVPRRDAGRVWSILQEYRMPSRPRRRFRDVFGRTRLLTTPVEERVLFLEALQGEIETTLESMNRVISARVHVVLPTRDLSGEPLHEAKASVVLEYEPDANHRPPLRIEEVRAIVAHAVEGLRVDRVSVIMKPIRVAKPNPPYELVSWGPLLVDRPSRGMVKAGAVIAAIILFGMGAILFRQGRVLRHLR